jgi:hypothetical protein
LGISDHIRVVDVGFFGKIKRETNKENGKRELIIFPFLTYVDL